MMVYPLYSSSKGNMFCIETMETTLLIDIGVSYKNIILALEGIHKKIDDITAILITHEHSDHIKGLIQLCKNHPNIQIIATNKTKLVLQDILCSQNILANIIGVEYGEIISTKDCSITPIKISHDAVMPCAYNINDKKNNITFATDLGYISDEMQNFLNNSDCNILESNFDKIMLEYGKYPASVKNRIRGSMGHLSNENAAQAIKQVLDVNPTSKFILSHMSENNNDLNLAKSTIFSYLEENNIKDPNIAFASKDLSFEGYNIC